MAITGTGLSSTIRVNFGAMSVRTTSVTATKVTCMIPEIPAGQYNVSVTTGILTSNSLPFFYIGPPMVTAVSPDAGPLTATSLTLFGENLATTTAVTFGDAGDAPEIVVVSNDRLTVVTPEHAPLQPGICTDAVNVVVTTAGGASPAAGAQSMYTYYGAPAVTGLRPSSGSVTSSVSVTGICLQGATMVTFTPTAGGQTIQADYVVVSPTEITAIVPPTFLRTHTTSGSSPRGVKAPSLPTACSPCDGAWTAGLAQSAITSHTGLRATGPSCQLRKKRPPSAARTHHAAGEDAGPIPGRSRIATPPESCHHIADHRAHPHGVHDQRDGSQTLGQEERLKYIEGKLATDASEARAALS